MAKDTMIIGVFSDRSDAEEAIGELKTAHYDAKDISIVTKNRDDAEVISDHTGTNVGDGVASGATTGGLIGGIAGLLIGIGAIAIPGVGALLIAGPLAAALGLTGAAATTVSGAVTGAVAGGLVGGLVGAGVPKEDATYYEGRVKEGGILVAVPARESNEDDVRAILEDNGADRVRTFGMNEGRHTAAL
ncbi:hypothetical protein BH09PAT1_BH09PAT1_1160 [soil metagenome]